MDRSIRVLSCSRQALAVSGQNVMLLAALVLFGGAVTGLALRPRLLLAMAMIAVYVPLAGGGPSIQRAGVMGIAGLVAALAGRPARRWYALGLAAAVTLAVLPVKAPPAAILTDWAALAALAGLAVRRWSRAFAGGDRASGTVRRRALALAAVGVAALVGVRKVGARAAPVPRGE